jgi:hypothetical protein
MNLASFSVGLVLLLAGTVVLIKNRQFLKSGRKTMAKIIQIKENWNSDGEGGKAKIYYPVLEFSAVDKKTYQFQSAMGGNNKNKYRLGQEVKIIYDPQKPNQAKISDFGSFWLMPMIMILAGIIILAANFQA